ncbi:MAG: aminopeptidase [Treponemataceae bacterium]
MEAWDDPLLFSDAYRRFLDSAKTERAVVAKVLAAAKAEGFLSAIEQAELKGGDRVYFENRAKNVVLAVIGKRPLHEGFRLIAAHADSPRLDLKPNPLQDEGGYILLKTQYYGGVKKYQWAGIPLALYGVVFLADGRKVDISIGDGEEDPVFSIPDLLPHLSEKIQNDRPSKETLKGEELRIVFGCSDSGALKDEILSKLKKEYGITEDDFVSAELQAVPAGRSREVGLDRNLIGAYGQDDRAGVFTAVEAIFSLGREVVPEHTALCFIVDKEEVGSAGSTGLESRYLEVIVGELLDRTGHSCNDLMLRRALWNSRALSADVTVGFDPVFKAVHDEQNAARLGRGIVLTKYFGGKGKMHSNDADAEYLNEIRRLFLREGVRFQFAVFGQVDEGGGATVSRFLANLGIRTVDAGPAVLGMHSPFELSSKDDIFQTYRGFKAFFLEVP